MCYSETFQQLHYSLCFCAGAGAGTGTDPLTRTMRSIEFVYSFRVFQSGNCVELVAQNWNMIVYPENWSSALALYL